MGAVAAGCVPRETTQETRDELEAELAARFSAHREAEGIDDGKAVVGSSAPDMIKLPIGNATNSSHVDQSQGPLVLAMPKPVASNDRNTGGNPMKTAEEVADKMYDMVVEAKGRRKYSPRELQSAAMELFSGEVDKKTCKDAVRHLMESGRCVYSTYGGVSYVEIPAEKSSD